jgi:hypothetical protein
VHLGEQRYDAAVADPLDERALRARRARVVEARALDEPPALERVARREDLGVGGKEPPRLRVREPLPGRPEDRDRERLHVARWDVDDEPLKLSSRYRLEVLADRLDVPVRDERRAGLEHGPRLLDEHAERAAHALGAELVARREDERHASSRS